MEYLITGCLVGSMTIGAAMDVKHRRIPNWLTVSTLVVALVVRAFPGGPPLSDGLLGFGLAFALTLPLFGFGFMGGGDVKLLMVVGALLGPLPFFVAFLYTSVVGGLMALATTVVSGRYTDLVGRCIGFVTSIATFGMRGLKISVSSPSAVTIPYGVAIAIGAVTAHFFPFIG